MMMSLINQQIFIGLALLMILWFVGGTWYNRRQGIRTLNWLREGLQSLGGQLHLAWIGSAASGAEATINKASPPFRQLNAIFLLESRELLPLWLVNLLRGKRDELIIKAHLRSTRRGEIEVIPAGDRLERSLRQESQSPWQWQEGPHSLRIAYRGAQGQALSAAVIPFLQNYGLSLQRFSWRRDKPHLLLRTRLAGLTDRPSADFFTDLAAVFAYSRESPGTNDEDE
jgi:hypothetical protein